MRSHRSALIILGAGLLTFAVVFAFLQVSRAAPASDPLVAVPTPAVLLVDPPSDSESAAMVAGQTAVGVPSVGSESLLVGVRPGDHLDVLASLPSPADSRPITVVVVSGATVLRPATSTDPLLLEVSGPDAIVLAHLVLGGTRLAYTVWPDGANPPRAQPLDETSARALLGLPATSRSDQPEQSPTPLPVTPTVAPTPGGRTATYTVLAGESLYSLATRLGIDAGALWWANRSVVDPTAPLVAGTRLEVPLVAGFLYQVQPGDTWDSVAGTFGVPASDLWNRNALPENSSLVSGMLLFIPSQS